jgi:hypothetical protein
MMHATTPRPRAIIESLSAPGSRRIYLEHPAPQPATVYTMTPDATGWQNSIDYGGPEIFTQHFATFACANSAFMALLNDWMTPTFC